MRINEEGILDQELLDASRHRELRTSASALTVKLRNRGMDSFATELETALSRDMCALRAQWATRTPTTVETLRRTENRLKSLVSLGTNALFELRNDQVYSDCGDVHVGPNSYTPEAALRKLNELRDAINSATAYRKNAAKLASALGNQSEVGA